MSAVRQGPYIWISSSWPRTASNSSIALGRPWDRKNSSMPIRYSDTPPAMPIKVLSNRAIVVRCLLIANVGSWPHSASEARPQMPSQRGRRHLGRQDDGTPFRELDVLRIREFGPVSLKDGVDGV